MTSMMSATMTSRVMTSPMDRVNDNSGNDDTDRAHL